LSRRILLINYEYPPFGGGAANATQELALALSKEGNSVSVLTAAYDADGLHKDEIEIIPVNSLRRRYGQSNLTEMASFLIKAGLFMIRLKESKWDRAIVFFGIPCGPIATLLKWRFQVPYVVSLRGGDVPGFESQVTWLHRFLTPVRRLVYRHSVAVVANSVSLANLSRLTDYSAVEVIPNGVDTDFFCPPSRSRTKEDSLKLLISNRFHRQKRIPETLKLLGQARDQGLDFRLLLVGEGPDEPEIKTAINDLSLEDNVTVKGWVGKEELAEIYRSADCFLSLAAYEGLPNSVLEAMASELLVILSDIEPHREIVLSGDNGLLVSNNDASAFLVLLARITAEWDRFALVAENGRKTVQNNFSWSKVAQSYLSLFDQKIE